MHSRSGWDPKLTHASLYIQANEAMSPQSFGAATEQEREGHYIKWLDEGCSFQHPTGPSKTT